MTARTKQTTVKVIAGLGAVSLLGLAIVFGLRRGDASADSPTEDSSARAVEGESRQHAANVGRISPRPADPAHAVEPRPMGDGWYVDDGHKHARAFGDAPNVNFDERFRPIGDWTGTDLELHKAMRECFTSSTPMTTACSFSVNMGLDDVEHDGELRTKLTYTEAVLTDTTERGCVEFAACAARSMIGRTMNHLDGVPSASVAVHDFKAFRSEGTVAERRQRLERQLQAYEDEMAEWRSNNPGVDPEDGPEEVRALAAYIAKAEWDLENGL